MTIEEFHNQRLNEVADDFRRSGYDVAVEPSARALPPFLEGMQPDLIATRGDEHVVVEVKTRRDLRASDETRKLADVLKDRSGWRLDLVLIGDDEISAKTTEPNVLSLSLIERRIDDADRLLVEGDRAAALLFAWIAVEAILRGMAAANQINLGNLSPQTAIRELVTAGIVDRETYRLLDDSLQFRNRVVHGFSSSGLGEETVRQLIAIGRRLLSEIESYSAAAVREDLA